MSTSQASPSLRERALEAWEIKQAADAKRREENRLRAQEIERKRQAEDMAVIAKSSLGDWFPDQAWEYVGKVQDGVVARAVGTDLLFVVVRKSHAPTEPRDYSLLICRPDADKSWLLGASRVETMADIGRVIADRERPAPEQVGDDSQGSPT